MNPVAIWLCKARQAMDKSAALVYGYAVHARKITISIVQEVLGDRDKSGLVPLRPTGPPRLVQQPNNGSEK